MTTNRQNFKISVVTVCYNAVETIEKTILSVLAQKYQNIEYIIIDGGSTDGTVNIIKKYADKLAYWVSEPDKGIYDAMNKGIAIATGDYINFMNAGDKFFSSEVIEQVCGMIHGYGLYYGDVLMRDAQGKCVFYGGEFNRYRLTYENICHQGIFYPLATLKLNNYDLSYPILADWNMNQWLFRTIPFNHLNMIVAEYVLGGVSAHITDPEFSKRRVLKIIRFLGLRAAAYYKIKPMYDKVLRLFHH